MAEDDGTSRASNWDLIKVSVTTAAFSILFTHIVTQRQVAQEYERTRQRDTTAHERQFELLHAEIQSAKDLAELQERHERERLEVAHRMEADQKLERLAAREAEARRLEINACRARAEAAQTQALESERAILDALQRLLRGQLEAAALTAAAMEPSASGVNAEEMAATFGEFQPIGRQMLSIAMQADELALVVGMESVAKPSRDTQAARSQAVTLLSVPMNLMGRPQAGMLAAEGQIDKAAEAPETTDIVLEPNLHVARAHMDAVVYAVGNFIGSTRADIRAEEQECYDY